MFSDLLKSEMGKKAAEQLKKDLGDEAIDPIGLIKDYNDWLEVNGQLVTFSILSTMKKIIPDFDSKSDPDIVLLMVEISIDIFCNIKCTEEAKNGK